MVPMMSLWLPILLSAVLVFIVSSIIHMVLGYHKNDFKAVPREGEVMDALRPFAVPPGDYCLPRASSMKEMGEPAFLEKLKRGPVLVMTVLPNRPFTMTKALGQWFVFSIVVSLFCAYVTGRALGPGADYLSVFRFAGTVAFAGYALGYVPVSIWYGRSWATTAKVIFDGFVYALFTGGSFGWLWPR